MIHDSGDRTQFATGAVRDMHEGKGRLDLLPFLAVLELAKHCEEGAKKYGEHNVDKGIPQHSLIDSAMRHLCKYAAGFTDEDHLRAAAWNVMWALEQTQSHPELLDVPHRSEDAAEKTEDPESMTGADDFYSQMVDKYIRESTMHKVPKISLNGVDYFPVENETKTVHEEEEEGKYYD